MFSDFWVEFLRLTNKLLKLDPTVLLFSSPHLREHDDDDDDGDDDDDDDDATCWRCDALDGMGKGKEMHRSYVMCVSTPFFLRCWIS